MKCPPNSHYKLCADTCSLTCSALSASPQCPESCAEGCQCDPSFLSDGQACVPIQQCGCYHNGVYYEVGPRSLRAEPGASRWTPSHSPSPRSLSTRPPECLSSPPLPPIMAPPWYLCPLPPAPSTPSLLPLLGHPPDGSGKTFLNTAMGPAALNPLLAPQL